MTGASRSTAPSDTSCMMAVAVNAFESDASWNGVSAVTGLPAPSATPNPRRWTTSPSQRSRSRAPGCRHRPSRPGRRHRYGRGRPGGRVGRLEAAAAPASSSATSPEAVSGRREDAQRDVHGDSAKPYHPGDASRPMVRPADVDAQPPAGPKGAGDWQCLSPRPERAGSAHRTAHQNEVPTRPVRPAGTCSCLEGEPTLGFEPRTCCLRNSCSTAELCRRGGHVSRPATLGTCLVPCPSVTFAGAAGQGGRPPG